MAFYSQLKIRFGDIDRAGIVYYPRFMHYFHVALEEFFASELGIEYHDMVETHRIGLPTVHLVHIDLTLITDLLREFGCRCRVSGARKGRRNSISSYETTLKKFLYRSDWMLVARGGARVKLHFKSWSWFYPGLLCIL
jgi:hypothetical protein